MTHKAKRLAICPPAARRRFAACLIVLVVAVVLAHVAYLSLTQDLLRDASPSVPAGSFRYHDVGGVLLIAWQLPASALLVFLTYYLIRATVSPEAVRRTWCASPRRLLIGSACVLVTFGTVWFGWYLGGRRAIEDDDAYLLQAQLLADGRVALPFPWEAFDKTFVWPWTFVHDDSLTSFQMPGHCAFLALGVILRLPWVIPIVQGLVMLVATYATARQAYGRRTAMLTSVLIVSSPYVLVTQNSYSASTSGAMCGALVLLAGARLLACPSHARATLCGIVLASLWTVRPPTAVAYAAPLAIMLLARCRRSRGCWRYLATTLVVGLIGLVPYFLYCRVSTGAWALSPGGVYTTRLGSSEIGLVNVLSDKGHKLITGIPNPLISFVRLNCYLFGWPVSLLPLLVVARCWRRWSANTYWLAATCILLIGFYCLSEKILGWYYYDLLPCLVILGARGTIELGRSWCRRSRRLRSSSLAIGLLAGAGVGASVLITIPAVLARQAHFVFAWSRCVDWTGESIHDQSALVFVDVRRTDGFTTRAALGANDARLENRIIYARFDGDAHRARDVRTRFPARTCYLYYLDHEGRSVLEPLKRVEEPLRDE